MALAGLFVLVPGCGRENPAARPEPPPPTVLAATAESRTVPIYADYVGQTEATLFVEIRARVDGFLDEIHFTEGELAEAGDPLFSIDPKTYQASVDRLAAQLEMAKATEARTRRDVERLKPLFEQNAASQKDYDDAVADAEEAAAKVLAAKAELAGAELELGYCTISSPISGTVGEARVDVGGLVGSRGDSLLTVVQKVDPIFVRFSMTSRDLQLLASGEDQTARPEDLDRWQTVTITLPSGEEYGFKGNVEFTDPEIDPKTGTFAVRARLPNPERALQPGEYTRVRLRLGWKVDAVHVPSRAVQPGQAGPYVMVLGDDDVAEERFITLGREWGEDAIVSEGLAAGERVVVDGVHKVRSGQRVRVVAPPAEAAGADD